MKLKNAILLSAICFATSSLAMERETDFSKRDWMNEKEICVIDCETTGLSPYSPHNAKMVQLTVWEIKNGCQTGEVKTFFFNPGEEALKNYAPAKHQLKTLKKTYGDFLRSCKIFDDQAEEIKKLLEGKIVVGYNVGFDICFLSQEFHNYFERKSFSPDQFELNFDFKDLMPMVKRDDKRAKGIFPPSPNKKTVTIKPVTDEEKQKIEKDRVAKRKKSKEQQDSLKKKQKDKENNPDEEYTPSSYEKKLLKQQAGEGHDLQTIVRKNKITPENGAHAVGADYKNVKRVISYPEDSYFDGAHNSLPDVAVTNGVFRMLTPKDDNSRN